MTGAMLEVGTCLVSSCQMFFPRSEVRTEPQVLHHHLHHHHRDMRRPACQLLARRAVAPAAPRCQRAFHASAPRRDPLLDAVLYLPHEMMNLIHSSVPWYAAIPITAFVTRGLLVATAGSWARALTARYIGLHPLRQALSFQKQHELLRTGNFRDPKQAQAAVKTAVKSEVTRLDARWNVTLRGQISWTFAQIPIFFAMAETIRQKSGARDGLLGMGFKSVKGEEITLGMADTAGTTSAWFAPSLANEGMLWFPDLLMPDPTGVLPFVVSGIMFANMYITKNTIHNEGSVQAVIRRLLLVISLLVGPMCQHLPAALMLYWGSSTCSVMLWNAWLDWKYPAPSGFGVCKRPLQMPPVPAARRRRV